LIDDKRKISTDLKIYLFKRKSVFNDLAKKIESSKNNSILEKNIVAISGLLLIAFIIFHLIGNLLILVDSPNTLNIYASKLDSLGIVRQILEIILLTAFLVHIFYAVTIARKNSQARTQPYYYPLKSVGNSSRSSIFSRSMVYTGPLLLLFIITHLKTFMFGAGITDGYTIEINGESIRDLQRLIKETFHQPIYSGFYILMMIPLGFHLRHGFKSAWQSLGIDPHTSELFDRVSIGIAIVISSGFAIVPMWIYWIGGY
jgi:succinate dehydrogenase / fumarate reductase, cytochrome b subunit